MKIQNIDVYGLYKNINFRWKLNPKVNILSGKNGSYKTTLINIINNLCRARLLHTICEVQNVEIFFTGDTLLKYKSFDDNLLTLKKMSSGDEMLNRIALDMKADIDGMDDETLSERRLAADIIGISRKKSNISLSDFKNSVNIDYISTFDIPESSNDEKDKKSYLDRKLYELERDYAYYLSDLSKTLLDDINSGKIMDKPTLNSIYSQRDLFLSIVQQAFHETEKKINDNKSRLEFVLKDKKVIYYEALSSGEKQFLIIMLTVLLEKKKEYILLMDEPEISMHYEWQKKLIENILKLNPNCQIILTTHSPALIMDGWEQVVTNIDTIKS